MEDWERKRIDERLTRLETELRELKLKLTLDEDKRTYIRWMENDRRARISMVAVAVFAVAVPLFVVVSRLAAGG